MVLLFKLSFQTLSIFVLYIRMIRCVCYPFLGEAIPRFAGQESRMEVINSVGHTNVSRCSINYARLVSGILIQFQDTAIFMDAQ